MATPKEQIGRVPAFSFEGKKGQFLLIDGGILECDAVEAVRQWFSLMLRQQPGHIPIYRKDGDRQIGIDRDLLRRDLDECIIRAEIQRQVQDTASFCPAVRTVNDFVFTRLRRGLQVSFTAYLHTRETVEISTTL